MGTFLFIFGLLVLLAGVAGAVAGSQRDRRGDRAPGVIAGGVLAILVGFGLVLGSTATTVDARSVGIQTSFGKYRDTLGPGFSWTAPWSDVEEWTTRHQTLRFAGNGKAEERENFHSEPFVTVRIAGQAEAYIDITITFKVTEASVRGLWEQHKTFDAALRDFAVPQTVAATGEVFDGHDPLARIRDPKSEGKDVGLGEWTSLLTSALKPMYAARSVELVEARVTFVRYDQPTTDKLNALNTEIANTALAAQKVETARKEAEASAARRASAGGDNCFALMRDAMAADQLKNLPPGWQCPGVTGPSVVSAR